jgi:hypothetical protein
LKKGRHILEKGMRRMAAEDKEFKIARALGKAFGESAIETWNKDFDELITTERRILKHLGDKKGGYISEESREINGLTEIATLYAIEQMLRNRDVFDVVSVSNYQRDMFGKSRKVGVRNILVETGYEKKESVLSNGFIFAKEKNTGAPFVLRVRDFISGHVEDGHAFGFWFRKDHAVIKRILDTFNAARVSYNPLKGAKIRIGKEISFLPPQGVGWDDVILPPSIMSEIHLNIVCFLKERAKWRDNRLPLHRTILISGKTGVGKKMIGKALVDNLKEVTFMWVMPDLVYKISEIFQIAKEVAPTIIFFEDMDIIGPNRFEPHDETQFRAILKEIDKLSIDDNLVFIATANDSRIERTLCERLGRFDLHIELKLPDDSLRRRMLEKYFHDLDLEMSEETLEKLVRETNGFT